MTEGCSSSRSGFASFALRELGFSSKHSVTLEDFVKKNSVPRGPSQIV